MTQQEQKTGYEQLLEKYGAQKVEQASRARTHVRRTFDKGLEKRLSSTPTLGDTLKLGEGQSIGTIQAEMDSIRMTLTALAEDYGQLNVSFRNTIGKEAIYKFTDLAKIGYSYIPVLGSEEKRRKVRYAAVERKGNAVETLVNMMADILQKQYEQAKEGKSKVETLQIQNIAHMKYLDKELIRNLKGGKYTVTDMATAEAEVQKLENELIDIEKILGDYDTKMQEAKATGKLEDLTKLTDEATKVLDIKHGVLDGRLAADGVVSNIRREILDSANGVEESRGAIAASKVNYRAISALVDSFTELEIKYRHARDYFIPVFKIQGTVAGMGMDATKLQKTLLQLSEVSGKLMETNAKLVEYVAVETFNLLKTPLYNVERAEAIEAQIKDYMKELNQAKMEWADTAQRLTEQTGTEGAQFYKEQ